MLTMPDVVYTYGYNLGYGFGFGGPYLLPTNLADTAFSELISLPTLPSTIIPCRHSFQ